MCATGLGAAGRVSAPGNVRVSPVVPEVIESDGAPVTLELMVFNAGAVSRAWTLPEVLPAVVSAPGQPDREVVLTAVEATGALTLAPGRFETTVWRVALPMDLPLGSWILTAPSVAGAVWPLRIVPADDRLTNASVGSGATAPAAPPASSTPTPGLVPRSELTLLERAFEDRLGLHDRIYFIYGADDPAAKFQFSFKYRLLGFEHGENPLQTLQFGYTQRSIWDINAASSPFYDTSYMPEVFYEWLAAVPEQRGLFSWLGLQSGYRHESNGRDGVDSRSLNIVYLRTAVVLGDIERWRAILGVRGFAYVGGLSNNPTIDDYRGNAEIELMLGRNGGVELAAIIRPGHGFDDGSAELNFTLPVRLGGDRLETYLLVQYFSGYGESLLNYEEKSETIRAGLSFVR